MKKNILFILLSAFIFWGCEDEPIGYVEFNAQEAIEVDSPLYNDIERLAQDNPDDFLVCIDFVYAFALNIFDEEQEYIDTIIIENDQQFSSLLGLLDEGHYIGLSFPIVSTTITGELIEINTKEELKAIIDLCIEEESVGYCNNLLTEENCKWFVVEGPDGITNPFVGSYFEVNDVGIASYHYDDQIYFGTWITFFIEFETHLNIFLDDDSSVGQSWNLDWIVTILDENNMLLERGDAQFYIQRECGNECSTHILVSCETSEGSELAEFILEDALECLPTGVLPDNYLVSFHASLEDAQNGENALVSPYLNVENPQLIYLRIEDLDSNEVTFTLITIVASNCEST